MDIIELRTENQLKKTLPIIREFASHLNEEQSLRLLAEMVDDNCHVFALCQEQCVISLAVVAIRTDLFNGRHLYILTGGDSFRKDFANEHRINPRRSD